MRKKEGHNGLNDKICLLILYIVSTLIEGYNKRPTKIDTKKFHPYTKKIGLF